MKPLGLAFLLAAQACAVAGALDQWQWRAPTPDHGSLFDCVTFQNGLFVAAGLGVLSTSTDGVHWTNRNPGTVQEIQSIAYGNGRFVGVGSGRHYSSEQTFGVVITSPDGITWTEQTHPANMSGLSGVAFGAGAFVAVGQRGLGNTILSSTNGVVWTIRNLSGANEHDMLTNDWQAVTFGYGKFVTVGVNYDYPSGGHAPIMTSPDTIHWYERNSNSSLYTAMQAVIYANGKFVAVGGEALTSSDGITWNKASDLTGYANSIAYGDGLFVTVGSSIRTSPDTLAWSEQVSATTNFLKGIAYGNGRFVAVGWGVMVTSTNGVDWIPLLDSGTPTSLSGVAYGNDQFVAIGYGGLVLRSPDGAQWTSAKSGTSNYLREVIWADDKFVAIGSARGANPSRDSLLSSSDGINWTHGNPGFTNSYDALSYGKGVFVAAAADYGVVFTSSNGLDWVRHELGSSFSLWDIAYGNGTFVGTVVYKGTVLTSPDGVQWTEHHTGATNSPMAIAYGNSIFVVLGTGFAQISNDGANWSPVRSLPSWFFPRRATYAQGTFVCVGDYGLIATSTNGLDWITRNSGTGTRLWGLAYGQHTVVTVGDYGTILQSGPIELSPARLTVSGVPSSASGLLRISLYGSTGQTWQLQSSGDLLAWTPLAELLLTNNCAEFFDSASNFSRFYRAVSP